MHGSTLFKLKMLSNPSKRKGNNHCKGQVTPYHKYNHQSEAAANNNSERNEIEVVVEGAFPIQSNCIPVNKRTYKNITEIYNRILSQKKKTCFHFYRQ